MLFNESILWKLELKSFNKEMSDILSMSDVSNFKVNLLPLGH